MAEVKEVKIRDPAKIKVRDQVSVKEAVEIVKQRMGEKFFQRPIWSQLSRIPNQDLSFSTKRCPSCDGNSQGGLMLVIGFNPKNRKLIRTCFACGSFSEEKNGIQPSGQKAGGNHEGENNP